MRTVILEVVSAALVVLLLGFPGSAKAVISVDIGAGTGIRGQILSIPVTLSSGGAEVVGVSNRIGFSPPLQIVAGPNGHPDCTVNPSILKEATAFRFTPVGCTPGSTCTGMKSDVLSFQNLDPIPNGVLYTCSVAISATAEPGVYSLMNVARSASDS